MKREFTLCRKYIPLIAITADKMQGQAQRCLQAGMDDYVSKPIHMADLKKCSTSS